MILQRVELDHFKAFERFTLSLRGDAYLAGPNNAGKSTLIAAIRTGAKMLRYAEQRAATFSVLDKGNRVTAHIFGSGRFGLVEDNLRYEFREIEARLGLRFPNGVRLTAVWPPDPELDPFFYVLDGDVSLTTPREVRQAVPSIGIVPVLSPVDDQEGELTSKKYARENLDGRLASRHFRNQLLLLEDEPTDTDYDAFLAFIEPWVPELRLDRIATRYSSDGAYLDLFFKERGSRIEKEVFWAGDGLQIWLQILLHVFRLRTADVIVLDEPDVFLHPDLQRRLVRLLDSVGAQAITATHSPELLAEAPPESVVWIDKGRRRSIRAPDDEVLVELVGAIGTQFNIRLARAIRATRVLFVEGDDMKLLRHLAETVGATNLSREIDMAVIPLQGYSNWDRIEPFAWLVRDLLRGSVEVFVALDRDYRSDGDARSVKARLRAIGVDAHIWRRKELESYLLDPEVIADVVGITPAEAIGYLSAATETLEAFVADRVGSERARHEPPAARAAIAKDARAEIASIWKSADRRCHLCPAKEVLSRVNQQLVRDGHKAVSFQRLARSMNSDCVPSEMRGFLLKVAGVAD
jgi:energy-coupling factor transporter ATP-binding protein EcfA2